MTELLYLDDSYLKEFEGTILHLVSPTQVILDRTCFYASGGGQPSDKGILLSKGKSYNVINVFKKDGEVIHEVQEEGLHEGNTIKGLLDWERRYTLMRYHTAAHVLSGIFHQQAGALITGNQLDVDQGRIDFDLAAFNKEKVQGYFDQANALIQQDLQTAVSYVAREEALKDPTLFKLAKTFPEHIKNIRILDIQGFDQQADGGTHVRSLKEIGTIMLVKCENKGKSNRRVYFTLS